MSVRPITRHGFHASVGLLVTAICVLGGFSVLRALPELMGVVGDSKANSSPSASPQPTSPMAGGPIAVRISPDADCGACHLETSGAVGTKPIPVLAHPLEGWTDCTACHADDRLVRSAPGHSGLHKADCLICHKLAGSDGAAPARPHHIVTGTACISCHGSRAPLPTDMQGRANCWLCHSGTEFNGLFGSPAPTVSPLPSLQDGG